jgi:hypothetical protein
MDDSELHLYGQKTPHEETFLVGNRRALEALAAAIQRVLEHKQPQTVEAFAGDGEGFEVIVHMVPDGALMRWEDPYYDDAFVERREDAVSPWTDPAIRVLFEPEELKKRRDRHGT